MVIHRGTEQLSTPRLLLRPTICEDAEPMFRNWASDPEVTRYLSWPTHKSVDVSVAVIDSWVNSYRKPDFYQWMIELKEIGEPIGSISVVRIDEAAGEMEVGYCIGRRWWRQGITSEALAGVMGFLFTQVGVRTISATHDTRNPNSGAVMRKCGMGLHSVIEQGGKNNLGVCDICVYRLSREDWQKN